jgi:hypothetical protein
MVRSSKYLSECFGVEVDQSTNSHPRLCLSTKEGPGVGGMTPEMVRKFSRQA